MKAQMKRLGFAYDWSREVTTCLPDYYRWNQWFFLKFFERGLAYRKKSKVNWCPKCATVLANEQVLPNGCCWRHEDTWLDSANWSSGSCARRSMRTNCFAIWTNWKAGRKKSAPCSATGLAAAKARWSISRWAVRRIPDGATISVFTTRVDTIYGATSVQLAPEHPIVKELTASNADLRAKVDQLIAEQRKAKEAGDIGEIEKHGVSTGRYAINPFNGEKVPVWVANYILMDYGTGAIMSVPAHDERDYEFAKKYKLEIRLLIVPLSNDPEETVAEPALPFVVA